MKTAVLMIVLALSSCAADSNRSVADSERPEASYPGQETPPAVPSKEQFVPVDGLVRFKGSGEDLKAAGWNLRIYSGEGEVWRVIDYNDDSIEVLERLKEDFDPRLFSNGRSRDFAIEMTCVQRSPNWYEVVVNEKKGVEGRRFIRTDDPLFEFLSWEKWVMGHFNLRFDAGSNPVLDSPNGSAVKASIPGDPLIKPVEVVGDWVKIRWTVHEPDEPAVGEIEKAHPENVGWIRWRKEGRTLIEEFVP